jgi:ubiquinone/menaquinone biosynthesis C-methylase UbiE
MKEVIEHYNKLIDENNDPVRDSKPLKDYMDKWDGGRFIESMKLNKNKTVLEIGVGTGRLAMKVAPLCQLFLGIDISPKTITRAAENLSSCHNIKLICDDFMSFEFADCFDVIYSSLTFMHIEDKLSAIKKIASLLNGDGIFVLSMDKNRDKFIDMGTRKIEIYPDDPIITRDFILEANLNLVDEFETEHAYVIVCQKASLV